MRTLATLLLGSLLVALLAGPVLAVEGGGTHYEYEEIRENASDVGSAFLEPDAEEVERPGFFDWMVYPLVAAGVLIAALIVVQYLIFQPRFAREAEERSRR